MSKCAFSRRTQQGAALILITFILGLATTAYLVKVYNLFSVFQQQDVASANLLGEAKAALIGFSFTSVPTSTRPGDMPLPDRLISPTESPPAGGLPNYDGDSDSCAGTAATMNCLGRLPWKTIGLNIDSPTQNDVPGKMPWYAVSANLVDPTCLGLFNPNVVNMTYVGYICNSSSNLPHSWITVRDDKGNVISNRVAFVLIQPGQVLGTQARPSSPLSDASAYLDSIVVPATCTAPCVPGTYSNADGDDDYIQGVQTATFNDKLVFVTIDEFAKAIQSRVLVDVKTALLAFRTANGQFPDAASIGYQGRSCIKNQSSGFLPLPICTCIGGAMCDCAFPGLIKFVSDKNYQTSTLNCTYSTTSCTCSGAGTCARTGSSPRNFSCSENGTCISNITGSFTYQPIAPIDTTPTLMSVTGSCSVSSSQVTCPGAGSFTIADATTLPMSATALPAWFAANGWKHYFYYAKGTFTVGLKVASSLVIGGGAKLPSQIRPSSLITNYLDSIENTNLDNQYDAVGTPTTSSYNDQMYIVSP